VTLSPQVLVNGKLTGLDFIDEKEELEITDREEKANKDKHTHKHTHSSGKSKREG